MAKANKTIEFTVCVEPPYTSVGIFTFLGAKDKGIAITSKPIELKHKSVIHIGENGGVEVMTTKQAKNRKKGIQPEENEG